MEGIVKILFLLLVPFLAEASPKMKLPWRWYSDPNIMSVDLERKLDQLPLSGSVQDDGRFWSGDYWALNKGNINYRWHDPRPTGFKLVSPTKEEAQVMSLADLSHLSPTEKYDLFTGRYDYPLRKEVEKIANKKAQSWEGICHGWAPATSNHKEPFAKGLTNPDGILIPFGSSDIKALISYYYAYGFEAPTHQMGWRCYHDERNDPWDDDSNTNTEDCKEDFNAGAFHIVMANKIALRNEGIIVDIMSGAEVWNHPIVSYTSKIVKYKGPKRDSARGTVQRAKVETLARVVLGTGNYWEPVRGTPAQKETTKKYVYWLDLNAANEIIGGEWDSDERPDFLWVKYRPEHFTGTMERIGELLND